MANWKSRTYSKDSESHGKALKELGASVKSGAGNGFGRPTEVLMEQDGYPKNLDSYDDTTAALPKPFKTRRLSDQGR